MSGGEKPAVHIYCLLFDGYETLDLMGPVEFLHGVPGARLHYVSHLGGAVRSTQSFSVATEPLGELKPGSVLLIPGGAGTRTLVHDTDFVEALTRWVQQSEYCLSVCTGSALLAATGLLNELEATTNKRAFDWVRGTNPHVLWQGTARWVHSGKFYTSSGVSAGMDMTLGFIADVAGIDQAQAQAHRCEYLWNQDPSHDPFSSSGTSPQP
nr:DJ-1/PfpI family protein [Rothia aeria]